MALSTRLNRIVAKYRFVPPEKCRGGPTLVLSSHDDPAAMADAPRCPHCRQPHVLIIETVIVEANAPETWKTCSLAERICKQDDGASP